MMKVMAIVIIIRPNFSHNIQLKNNNWLEIKNVSSFAYLLSTVNEHPNSNKSF